MAITVVMFGALCFTGGNLGRLSFFLFSCILPMECRYTIYVEIFVLLKFCVTEIVMLFHNIHGVKF